MLAAGYSGPGRRGSTSGTAEPPAEALAKRRSRCSSHVLQFRVEKDDDDGDGDGEEMSTHAGGGEMFSESGPLVNLITRACSSPTYSMSCS